MIFQGIDIFRRRLAAGEVLLGSGIGLIDPQVSEALAESVDFLWIDLEHAPMSPEAMRGHLLAARGRRRAIVVRVPASDTVFIKPVLDAGAPGIVALPGLDSVVLGPYDLSGSLGVLGQVHHPEVVTAMERVIASVRSGLPR